MSDFSSSVKHPIVDDSEHEQPSLKSAKLQLEQTTIDTEDRKTSEGIMKTADPDNDVQLCIAQLKQQLIEQLAVQQQQFAEKRQQLAEQHQQQLALQRQQLAEQHQQQLAEHYQQQLAEKSNEIEQLHKKIKCSNERNR
jgi:hypothetical protein